MTCSYINAPTVVINGATFRADEMGFVETVRFIESPPQPELKPTQINYYPEQKRGKGKARKY